MNSKLTGEGDDVDDVKKCLNVRQKQGTRNVLKLSLSHSISFYMLNNFCFHGYAQKSLSHSHSHTPTLSHYLTLLISHSHSFTLSFTHSPHAEQLLFSCLCSKVTRTLSHSHSFSLSHSFNLSFNHSRHAEQVLFSSLCSKVAVYRRKLQCFFLPHPPHHPLL